MIAVFLCASCLYAQNIAFQKTVTVSSVQAIGTPGEAATDGIAGSRWASEQGIDPQWLSIDLGSVVPISRVRILWEAAYAKNYELQVSTNGNTWSSLRTITNNTSVDNNITGLNGSGRYLRIWGTARGTVWGYSIYEVEVYKGASDTNARPVANAGADKSVTLPLNRITLTGASSDTDGFVTSYAWTQVSGPSTAVLADAGTTNLTASNLIAGNYVFRLTVTDNAGMTGTDDVTVTVTQGTASANLALGHDVVVSSTENGGTPGNAAVDGDGTTRWSSAGTDSEWLYVDLGTTRTFSRVKIQWETAYGKDYLIQTSTSASGPWQTIREVHGNSDLLNDHQGLSGNGRYLRIFGLLRGTGYGYSIYELEVYEASPNQPVTIPLASAYVQYMELNFSPAAQGNVSSWKLQNTDGNTTISYSAGTMLTLKVEDYRGQDSIEVFTTNRRGETMIATNHKSFTTMVYPGMAIGIRFVKNDGGGGPVNNAPVANAGSNKTITLPVNCVSLDGSRSFSPNSTIATYAWSQVSGPNMAALTGAATAQLSACALVAGTYTFRLAVTNAAGVLATDDVKITVLPAEVFDFSLISPAVGSMLTTTRKPVFTWNAVSGATRYDIYVNISRTDYDWHASGNFLDRYTKVGQSTQPTFTMPTELTDRWTYKWYVIAATPGGDKKSNKLQFSVYIPTLEQQSDAINIVNGARDLNKNGSIEPYEDWRQPIETRINDLMSRLTLEEKYKQCFYADNQPLDGFSFSYGVESGMRELQFNAAGTRLGIPIAFAGDKIHGWKTIFPTELGLAATRDMDLVYRSGNLQRKEHKFFGFTGTLAPLAEVDTKVLYPRFQEGAGENADEAAAIARALIVGMQGGPEINPHSMLITLKHWPGQGAGGESVLQYDATTIKYHMRPWQAVVEANAASVMPGYNNAPFLDPSGKGANSSKLIIDYLRDDIGFKGFIVTDWLAANTAQSVESMGAGIDVMGGAPSANTDVSQLVAGIGLDRLNEAVRRVLDMKFRLGLFENPYGDATEAWTNEAHHAIALEGARKSITLLKNNGVLPLKVNAGETIIVGGPNATWVNQDADPNVIWQSIYYSNPQAKNYLKAFQDRAAGTGANVVLNDASTAKVAVVVIGEKSYTHGTEWEDKNPVIPDAQLNIIKGFRNRGIKVVTVVITPRPYVLSDVINNSDAVMLVYRGGNGIAQATAELSYGDYNPAGKLPFQLPRSVDQIGTDNVNNQKEHWELPYDLGATDAQRIQIRAAIEADQAVPTTYGDPLYAYGYGILNFTTINAVASTVAETAVTTETQVHNMELYPNPASDQIALQYSLKQSSRVSVSISHALGGKQAVVLQAQRAEGSNRDAIDISSLSKGVYIIRLETTEGVSILKFMKQ